MSFIPKVKAFFHEATNTVSYLVWDSATFRAAVIDPVLDYDHASGKAGTASARQILSEAAKTGLKIEWILETHVHADHLSAAPFFKNETKAVVAIGEKIKEVQKVFRPVFNINECSISAGGFDRLLRHGDRLDLGTFEISVLHTPGHTPACVSYLIGDAVFVGDTLFMPDYGSARTDFPGGSAIALYRSARYLLSLPPETRMFLCHDYKAPGRDQYKWETTVREQKESNVHLRDEITESEFVRLRKKRDLGLRAPNLLMAAIQVNMHAGQFPKEESNGLRYLRIPVSITA